MAVVTMRQLLEAGVHFGHQTRRWNPKMRRFIYGERNGIYVIDLRQTVGYIERAYSFTRDLVAQGGTMLFVGTKKQAQETIQWQAERVGMPYVTERWMGGMLTNFVTMKSRISRLKELEAMDEAGTYALLPKKEVLELEREHERLQRYLGGIREMEKLPDAVWIVDTVIEEIAVKEANRLDIPVVGILDTNCDPDMVQYPIPGNDDAIRASALLTRIVADACADGLLLRASRSPDEELRVQAMQAAASAGGGLDVSEPKAEWEIELERQQAAEMAAQAGAAPVEAVTGATDTEEGAIDTDEGAIDTESGAAEPEAEEPGTAEPVAEEPAADEPGADEVPPTTAAEADVEATADEEDEAGTEAGTEEE